MWEIESPDAYEGQLVGKICIYKLCLCFQFHLMILLQTIEYDYVTNDITTKCLPHDILVR